MEAPQRPRQELETRVQGWCVYLSRTLTIYIYSSVSRAVLNVVLVSDNQIFFLIKKHLRYPSALITRFKIK